MKLVDLLEGVVELPDELVGSQLVDEIIQFDVANQRENALMWVNSANVARLEAQTKGVVIGPSVHDTDFDLQCVYIGVEDPRDTFRQIMQRFHEQLPPQVFESNAAIADGARIGAGVQIGRNVVVESGVTIGDGCSIGHGTVLLEGTELEPDVSIGSNCVLGGDGFGFVKSSAGRHEPMPHVGGVLLKRGVIVHSNSCIDRAVLGKTTLGAYTRVDNHVHIGHGVVLGDHCVVAAQVVVGGSTMIGDNCYLGIGAAVNNKLFIGSNSYVGVGAVVIRDVEERHKVFGNPARQVGLVE